MQNSMFIRVHKRILNYTTTNTVHNAHIMKFCGEMHGQVFHYRWMAAHLSVKIKYTRRVFFHSANVCL